MKRQRREIAERIFERDGWRCRSCGAKYPPYWDFDFSSRQMPECLVVGQIEPDGGDGDDNLQTLCWSCNSAKAGKSQRNFDLAEAVRTLGRPVAFYPSIARAIGMKESLLLCQLIYWTPRARHDRGDAWIYKSAEQLEAETGLSYREQRTARANLVKAGLLEEQYERIEHRLYFRVNAKALRELALDAPPLGEGIQGGTDEIVNRELTNRKVAPDKTSVRELTNRQMDNKETEITTETTQITTSELSALTSPPVLAAPKRQNRNDGWPDSERPILEFLQTQQFLKVPMERFGLLDWEWWSFTMGACGGISVEMLKREFPKLAAWLKEKGKRLGKRGARPRIRHWLQIAAEQEERRGSATGNSGGQRAPAQTTRKISNDPGKYAGDIERGKLWDRLHGLDQGD